MPKKSDIAKALRAETLAHLNTMRADWDSPKGTFKEQAEIEFSTRFMKALHDKGLHSWVDDAPNGMQIDPELLADDTFDLGLTMLQNMVIEEKTTRHGTPYPDNQAIDLFWDKVRRTEHGVHTAKHQSRQATDGLPTPGRTH